MFQMDFDRICAQFATIIMDASSTSNLIGRAEPFGSDLAGIVVDALDDSLSQWQVQIGAACSAAISRELKEQICSMRALSTELKENQRSLDTQRESVEGQLAEALRLKSRYSRQRKTLAKEFRAQRAEMELSLERQRATLRQEVEASLRQEFEQSYNAETDQCAADLESQLAAQMRCTEEQTRQLRESQAATEKLREEGHELRQLLNASGQVDEQIAQLKRELLESNALVAAIEVEEAEKARALQNQIVELVTELSNARESLAASQTQIVELQQASENDQDPAEQLQALHEQFVLQELELAEQVAESGNLESELESIREVLQQTRKQLHEFESRHASDTAEAHPQEAEKLEQLQDEVYEKQLEILDLRSQNSDLASQVAKHQVLASSSAPHVSFNQESLSWEERKQLILQQLEREMDQAPTQESQSNQLEIQKVISATQLEIERRDREIAELQSIVQQQSNTREGVAIGAAAIAQMIDSDELVNQERQKLKSIQQEWEEKLRKAEIDLSLERAKLARERSMLEAERSEVGHVSTEITAEEGETKAQTRTRKWLQHLGLKQNQEE